MGNNLTGQLISATYEQLVQISGSILTDGTGSNITSLDITASNAVSALSANSASVATSASFADTSISASFATTASFALNAGAIDSGSFMITGSVSSNTLTFEKGDGSTFNLTVDTGSAVSVNTGSLLVTASISDATITFTKGDASTFNIVVNNVSNAVSASHAVIADSALTATSASHALNADNAISSSYSLTATSASHALASDTAISASHAIFADTAGFATDVNALYTASVSDATISFLKGGGGTFPITINNVANAVSASYAATASFLPADTNLNINSITASGGNFVNLTATSASFGHVTTVSGSAVIIGNEFIILNADTPAARYAGVIVYDSGSGSPATASFEWDGLTDNWIIMEETGNTAVVLTGPTGSRGTEVLPTVNVLQKGGGHHQLVDSSITDNGTNVTFTTPIAGTSISASSGFLGNLAGTASFATTASFALNAGGGELSGLISGSGTDSLISANYQSTASFALGVESIAIGNNTQADSANQVILGTDITSSGGSNDRSITIGTDNILQGSANDNVLIGNNFNAQAGKNKVVYIGNNPGTNFVNSDSVCIGYDVQAAILNVSIGNLSRATGNNAVSVGYNAISNAEAAISIGRDAFSSGQYDVTLGYDARTETGNNAITIGKSARNISANDSIVIGNGQSVGVANEINIGGIFRYNSGSSGEIELISNSGSVIYKSGALSGSLIDNITDIYTSTAAIEHVVSLTQVEYNAISASADPNTLYYITDAPGATTPTLQEVTTAGAATSASITLTDGVVASNVINGNGSDFTLSSIDASTNLAINFFDASSINGGFITFDVATGGLNIAADGGATLTGNADTATSASHALNADNAISSSFALTASYAEGPVTLGSNTFTGDQVISSASLTIDGPVYGGVSALSISSNTASMDLTVNNFFTLTLVSGSNTFINPTNITAGQTINLRVTQPNPGFGTVSFPSSVNQVSGSAYVPTAVASAQDIVTFIAFDSSDLYLSNVKNLV